MKYPRKRLNAEASERQDRDDERSWMEMENNFHLAWTALGWGARATYDAESDVALSNCPSQGIVASTDQRPEDTLQLEENGKWKVQKRPSCSL